MKNQIWLLLAVFFQPFLAPAQIKKCHTYESLQEYKKQNPGAQTDAQFEGWLHKKIKETPVNQRLLSAYTIPVIFHIVHDGEPVGLGSNISAESIQQQLDQLNADFANTSGSRYAVAADAQMRFVLAVIDPQGRKLPEPGIERINRNEKSWQAPPYNISSYNSFADQTIMPATIWSPYRYFNVWVMNIALPLVGKATFPSASTLEDLGAGSGDDDTHSGVMIHYGSVGSVASAGPFGSTAGLGRTLTHEAGHFFGLRHIWGDAACGDDYCNDTPAQDRQTEECPTGQLANNCTPATDKMYENYMDYTFDACVNTFTADQVTRMQTVMLNSPRRKELAQSGVHMAPPANTIRLAHSRLLFSETAVVTSACPAYREVVVDINAFEAADGAATLHFYSAGTAVQGKDYELLTPTLTFGAGDKSRQLVLRVYDDGLQEDEEDIVLAYTISGSGVQAAEESQTLTITLTDNDIVRRINNTGSVQLLAENFGIGGSAANHTWYAGSFISPAGANRWTISSNGGTGFTGQSAHITNNTSTRPNTYTLSSTSDAYLISNAIDARGLANISVSFKYRCVGEGSANGGIYDYGTLIYSLDGVNFQPLPDPLNNNREYGFFSQSSIATFSQVFEGLIDNQIFYLGFRWVNDYADGTSPGFTVDDIVISGQSLSVAQSAGLEAKQPVMSGQSILLKNNENTFVIAAVNNAAADLGCVTATLVQAGTGTAGITTSTGTYLRTQKVVQITPAQQAAATVTLYYTAAELAAWGDAKGALKVLKVKDDVSLDGVLNTSNAELITPDAVTEFAAEGYTAYTFKVNSFSQFMLVSPTFTLPVQLVQFEAQPHGRQVQLQWRTQEEKDNKGFWVERSINGSSFAQVGWVGGTGGGAYRYTDRQVQPGVVYYYRLQQVDMDGKTTFSAVRQAKIEGTGLQVQVSPNPATDKVSVWVSGSSQPFSLRLINAAGSLAGQWQQVHPVSAPFEIPMGHLPKGLYTLLVITADGIQSQKIIKR